MAKTTEKVVDETPATDKKTAAKTEPRFSKGQFMARYPKCKDVLKTVLADDQKYTKAEVKKRVTDFRDTKI